MREPKSKFLKVKCEKCNNEQVIFNKAASTVRCLVCSNVLSEPTGGKSEIKSKVIKTME